MDTNFLEAQAERCRILAENADELTKRRLLDLAANYDKRLTAAGPSAATRILKAPFDLNQAYLSLGSQVRRSPMATLNGAQTDGFWSEKSGHGRPVPIG